MCHKRPFLGQLTMMTARKTVKPEDLSQAMEFYFGLFHPFYRECKLDELTRYIIKYCQEWMTEDERRTTQYLAFMRMSQAMTNQKGQTYWKNQANKLWNDRIESNLKDGEEVFHYRVKDRLIAEYGNKPLNLCPRCKALARTAQAKQCQKCYYDWHEQA